MVRLSIAALAATGALVLAPAALCVSTAPPEPAQQELGRFALSVLSFAADHHDRFTGLRRSSLARYDAKLDPRVRVGQVTASTFCIEMRFRGVAVKMSGTRNDFSASFGRCLSE
ncbi:MAG: hypothetical protein ABUS54_07135 [Actinomycetota bacterium]